MKDKLDIGSIILKVHMTLTPEGFASPYIEKKIVSLKSKNIVTFMPYDHFELKNLNVVQKKRGGRDSFEKIYRYGYCLVEDLETFKSKMINEIHDVLVDLRNNLCNMQIHLNGQHSKEVDTNIVVDWEKYRCRAFSDSYQWVYPNDEGYEMDWSSTEEVMKLKYVEIEDLKNGIIFTVDGLEGLNETSVINLMKKAVRDYEDTTKFIIVSDDGFWSNKDGWMLSKKDATRFLDKKVALPIGKRVKLIPESKKHTFIDEGQKITE